MKLCSEFRGYVFWYRFIEFWPKSMKIMGLCTAYSLIMQSWVAGGLF